MFNVHNQGLFLLTLFFKLFLYRLVRVALASGLPIGNLVNFSIERRAGNNLKYREIACCENLVLFLL
jgi:hypothetical protein